MKDAVPNEHTAGVMHTFFEPAWALGLLNNGFSGIWPWVKIPYPQ